MGRHALRNFSVVLFLGCGSAPEEPVVLTHIAASEAIPPSLHDDVVLLAEDLACVVDTYLFAVHCGDPAWSDVVSLSVPEGPGPPEFRSLDALFTVRGDRSAVGVIDGLSARAHILPLVADKSITSFTVPHRFKPMGPLTETLVGLANPTPRGARIVAVDTSGTVAWSRGISIGEVVDTPPYLRGGYSGDGTFVVQAYDATLGHFNSQGDLIGTSTLPNQGGTGKFSDHDIRSAVRTMKAVSGFDNLPPEILEGIQGLPRPYVVRATLIRTGPAGTHWIAIHQEGLEHPVLAVFRGKSLLGLVSTRDKLLGFDIRGDLLVTLSLRTGEVAEDEPSRGLDWYSISLPPQWAQ